MPETRTVERPDGRVVSYASWGDPRGRPLLLVHGTPGSRLSRSPDPELYARLDAHVVPDADVESIQLVQHAGMCVAQVRVVMLAHERHAACGGLRLQALEELPVHLLAGANEVQADSVWVVRGELRPDLVEDEAPTSVLSANSPSVMTMT